MNVKRFYGKTVSDAMNQVKQAFGNEAVILQDRQVIKKRFLGLKKETIIEVIAATEEKEEKRELVQKPVKHVPNVPIVERPNLDAKAYQPEQLERIVRQLEAQGVEGDTLKHIQHEMYPLYYKRENEQTDVELLEQALRPLLVDPPFTNALKDDTTVAIFVGQTGVGKTTTLAKIAALYKLKKQRTVGFITCDTYRIAAVDQLITYSNILDVPIEVAYTKEDYRLAKDKLKHVDILFVDTAGRNYQNADRVEELCDWLGERDDTTEVVLALSLTAKESDLLRVCEQFEKLHVDQLLFTKFDETKTIGEMLTIMEKTQLPVLAVTNGQAVPDDLLQLNRYSFANYFVKGGCDRERPSVRITKPNANV
ncbi:hypothetical protein ACE1TF_02460 [Geomicrobium sp. JSM 1781026]|uniref:flagellar biosynthesis protein FlhF n=1 Tax=Geomicrobium sp. JSM 1781026 TaxID=3344580 RepID=UPI0035C037D8